MGKWSPGTTLQSNVTTTLTQPLLTSPCSHSPSPSLLSSLSSSLPPPSLSLHPPSLSFPPSHSTQFHSSFPATNRNRLASILTTRPRTISLSQVSDISSLDLGVRTKPFPRSTLEQQLRLAQEDLHRLLEYACVSCGIHFRIHCTALKLRELF